MTYAPISSPCRNSQQGGAMLVMIVILVIGIVSILASSLSATAIENRRNQVTADALARAKEALIGYAITYGDTHPGSTHGYLPCPDIDGTDMSGNPAEGSSKPTCGNQNINQIGRFPWRTLDLPDLFDGTGECLWYAVSGTYKNNPPTGNLMNWDNASLLHVYAENGTEISPGDIVAVVIAPGPYQSANSSARTPSGTAPTCGGNYTATAYLDNDTIHGKNNADGTNFILPHEHRDASGNVTLTVNDKFVFITRQDIWYAIQKRIAQEAKKCLDDYAAMPVPSNGNLQSWKYPWAVPVTNITTYLAQPNTYFGRLPAVPNAAGSTGNPDVDNMLNLLAALQAALDAYNAGTGTSANLKTAGGALENSAKYVRDHQPTSPAVGTSITTPAIQAGDKAKDGVFSSVQGYINSTNIALSSAGISLSVNDATMSTTWPTTCTLFASSSWQDWRDLVFYQVAKGYQPNSGADCATVGTCLTVNNAGAYRAAVIVAGKKFSPAQTRTAPGTNPPNDYLANNASEPDPGFPVIVNAHDSNSVTPLTSFRTYNPSDSANFSKVNDLVLCVDGQVNCK